MTFFCAFVGNLGQRSYAHVAFSPCPLSPTLSGSSQGTPAWGTRLSSGGSPDLRGGWQLHAGQKAAPTGLMARAGPPSDANTLGDVSSFLDTILSANVWLALIYKHRFCQLLFAPILEAWNCWEHAAWELECDGPPLCNHYVQILLHITYSPGHRYSPQKRLARTTLYISCLSSVLYGRILILKITSVIRFFICIYFLFTGLRE